LIEFVDVYKVYKGGVVALQGASFTVPSGTLACLLGPNGAGKTTTMKLIMGFLRPSSGTVKVWGLEPWIYEKEVRSRIGFLPERPIYPSNVRVYTFLKHLANLRRVPVSDVHRVSKLVGIEHLLDREIKTLSRGYVQRVGIAQALLGDPELLLLDEPTANLDPRARREILELVKVLHRDLGVTIIISSHIIPELQEVARYAIFIDRGKVLDHGSLEELARKYVANAIYVIESSRPRDLAIELLKKDYVRGIYVHDDRVEVHVDMDRVNDLEEYIKELAGRGMVKSYSFRTAYLGEIYEKIVGSSHG